MRGWTSHCGRRAVWVSGQGAGGWGTHGTVKLSTKMMYCAGWGVSGYGGSRRESEACLSTPHKEYHKISEEECSAGEM